ncbi:acyl-CoA thioesterase II [Microbacterium sp. MPKO10]|uniref:acyl-CoA thioesterase n=1 Tax=Microbacterium sp. MPKO10 TaxID=2989818 RepID=UPI002235BFBF|nr:acyl-CoA thioesterase II [Microbacterium sp. MPKO10]MCW4459722.1 acyl-CoA thioesterase II [Microbacterium sp. MPKO10]
MSDPVESLLGALDLTDTGARTLEDIFTGPSQWMPQGRVFGGQVLAQSIVAAGRTVPDDRFIHSMHGYFLRPGDVDLPITFAVDRIHDGRSFMTRRTQAYQRGLPILSLIASFQDDDSGLDHATSMPDAPDPESLASDSDLLASIDDPRARAWAADRPFEIRHVTEPIYLAAPTETTSEQVLWLRAKRDLPDDRRLHQAALAYASDYTLLEPILRSHGLSWLTPGLKMASLDHAMWWHRPARVDEWLLYVQESPSATGGRGLTNGRFYTRDGSLVASVAQEGMVRVPQGD